MVGYTGEHMRYLTHLGYIRHNEFKNKKGRKA